MQLAAIETPGMGKLNEKLSANAKPIVEISLNWQRLDNQQNRPRYNEIQCHSTAVQQERDSHQQD